MGELSCKHKIIGSYLVQWSKKSIFIGCIDDIQSYIGLNICD